LIKVKARRQKDVVAALAKAEKGMHIKDFQTKSTKALHQAGIEA
jgi:hypothetical protein